MAKVIKALGSPSRNAIDIYTEEGKVFPFTYSPSELREFIKWVESEEPYLSPFEEGEVSDLEGAEDIIVLMRRVDDEQTVQP